MAPYPHCNSCCGNHENEIFYALYMMQVQLWPYDAYFVHAMLDLTAIKFEHKANH